MTATRPQELFVYGTLRKGEMRSMLLERCRLIGVVRVPGILHMTSFGYPAAVFNGASSPGIQGEVYRLPDRSEDFMKEIDRAEGTDEGLFSRTVVCGGGNFFHAYEAGPALQEEIKSAETIRNGNWFFGPSLSRTDPFSFAVGFEDIHKLYYRMKHEEGEEKAVFLEGDFPVLVTCPHSTAHTRMGKLKRHEFYTAALGTIAHSALGCHCLYACREQETDPNYYDDCDFKTVVGEILSEKKIRLVVDLHGTGNERAEDLFPGVGIEREFLLGNPDILDMFYASAKEHGIVAGASGVFSAARQMTVAKFAAVRFSVPAIQIEMSDRLRMPETREKEFRKVLDFLPAFIGKVSG